MGAFERTEKLIGTEGVKRLAQKRVAVFGVGGVGGHVCEALVRAGVGALDIFDDDTVAESNLNRQIVALRSTLGQPKARVMAQRAVDINPACTVRAHLVFYTPQNAADYPFDGYNYVVDAVDTVTAKLEIIARAKAAGVPVISSMGTGNKLHPEAFYLADIGATSVCPLARVMRKELKKRGVSGVQVVCSGEAVQPLAGNMAAPDDTAGAGCAACAEAAGAGATPARPGAPKTNTPGSISFVPGAAGLVIAGAVVRGLLGLE